jgi:collagenase-like PrtC family protease
VTPRLSLGPVFFNWAPEALRDFYFRIADEAPVDTVYLGEIVCSKRAPFFAPHAEAAIDRLRAAGKEVVLSTLALVAGERDAAAMRALAAEADLAVEANDLGVLPTLAGKPHDLGPFINVYSESTLTYLAARGARRACLPPELPAHAIAPLAAAGAVALEAVVWGRLPLALSARCFHARAHGLHKDGCQFVCARDPEGLVVETLDHERFLAINGTQTLSYTCCNLVAELPLLRGLGVASFRLLPTHTDMAAVAAIFRRALTGAIDAAEALAALTPHANGAPFANGFLKGVEGRRYLGEAAPARA